MAISREQGSSSAEFLPFALPDIGEEEIAEVVDSLRSGWLTTGPKTRQFENEFRAFIGGDEVEAVSVNSATAGLHLALEAVGIGPDDEVITTPYTFTATAEVIRYLGAHPRFVDIDPATLNLDVRQVEGAITKRTRAILPVHFGGLACDMAAIMKIARRHGLAVVEDAAHALPTTSDKRLIGSLDSDATVFSFYATKTITTGEGGMVVTRRPDLAARVRTMRLHGIDRDAFNRYRSSKPAWYYEVVAAGFKYNLTDVASSLGIHQLRKAMRFQQQRARMAQRYDEAFADLPIIRPPGPPSGEMHSWHLYAMRLKQTAPIDRDDFIARMADRGIGCSVHFIPLHLHPVWRDAYGLARDAFPNALTAYEGAVSLPLYTKMTTAQQERVITTTRELLSK